MEQLIVIWDVMGLEAKILVGLITLSAALSVRKNK